MSHYDHIKIEKRWQKEWVKKKIFKVSDDSDKPKHYVLDMFPYPSGEGLHVGHPKGYIATDVYSRFKVMNGFNVLHPMGWDAFGLPAENYAIKTKTNPVVAVKKNVAYFKSQIEKIGLNYDWSREINTTDPAYYKWTQWIFLQMFKKGLAYESNEPVNWCPVDKTVLANEDVEDGKCERCGTPVEKRALRQWVLKITDYADRLLQDLDTLTWPESIKESQRNWIGRSEGSLISFKLNANRLPLNASVEVFTTRADTLFGVTYVVLAPEHGLLTNNELGIKNYEEVKKYIEEVRNKPEIERTAEGKEKTGVELKGIKAINPANGEEVPVFVADYVLASYGTGAVMAVPAHDERDFAFAKKYNLPIKRVIAKLFSEGSVPLEHKDKVLDYAKEQMIGESVCYIGNGKLINSGKFDGMDSEKAKKEITEFAGGKMTVKYKLKDWVFSRQRYWGEPIPVIHCEKCGVVPVPEKDLPLKLPPVKSYEPTGTGESPLANISKWVNVKCPVCKRKARRETNTMPQWAGSSWYYLRYIDPKNKKALVDSKKEKYWMGVDPVRSLPQDDLRSASGEQPQPSLRRSASPIEESAYSADALREVKHPQTSNGVDMYVGGAEHATRHLIYARFWHKFLYDIGAVSTKEPFKHLKNQGLIMGEAGRKMSKRWGNVVNPDDVVKLYGADTLRLYEMFMGPFEASISWSTNSMIGARRFIERVWRLQEKVQKNVKDNSKTLATINKTIKKVGEDISDFKFNTAVSAMMIAVNDFEDEKEISEETYLKFIKILSPFAPHIAEEIWKNFVGKKSIYFEKWPDFDASKIAGDSYEVVVQINGKVRGSFKENEEWNEEKIKNKTLEMPEVKKWTEGKEVRKIIFVKGKLVNIVI